MAARKPVAKRGNCNVRVRAVRRRVCQVPYPAYRRGAAVMDAIVRAAQV
jgi:hypothetical protein